MQFEKSYSEWWINFPRVGYLGSWPGVFGGVELKKIGVIVILLVMIFPLVASAGEPEPPQDPQAMVVIELRRLGDKIDNLNEQMESLYGIFADFLSYYKQFVLDDIGEVNRFGTMLDKMDDLLSACDEVVDYIDNVDGGEGVEIEGLDKIEGLMKHIASNITLYSTVFIPLLIIVGVGWIVMKQFF